MVQGRAAPHGQMDDLPGRTGTAYSPLEHVLAFLLAADLEQEPAWPDRLLVAEYPAVREFACDQLAVAFHAPVVEVPWKEMAGPLNDEWMDIRQLNGRSSFISQKTEKRTFSS